MANGDRLSDLQQILRRFDPTDDRHCTHDDAGGPAMLRASALQFKAEDVGMACSVYQTSKLAARGLTVGDCIEDERPHFRLAAVLAGDAQSFKRENIDDPNPFGIIEDEFPDGNPGPHPRDGAHAAIVHPQKVPGIDKWCRDLARKFRILSLLA